ncbi:uncharacterized protein AMSG_03601 [Thecamonas trahens ATCC 50062]|uniref:Uncharacterized protein n=1 Tax=Thecamonas trahens ATCC 50062 TaxID=461836 RepID=A0A0L0D797_THETB|nr:hypothetical protein AMSG_03601 [Thecamonas trahens ATCC 50062]KNC47173.1 hypothetical protein AMSG_03601 [Thecamonas trahens ATCC 50062]|eukprot:XP_013759947.1 hypothetical protein AMSG_03601 [Thecamonas trahens ATCC 50062]
MASHATDGIAAGWRVLKQRRGAYAGPRRWRRWWLPAGAVAIGVSDTSVDEFVALAVVAGLAVVVCLGLCFLSVIAAAGIAPGEPFEPRAGIHRDDAVAVQKWEARASASAQYPQPDVGLASWVDAQQAAAPNPARRIRPAGAVAPSPPATPAPVTPAPATPVLRNAPISPVAYAVSPSPIQAQGPGMMMAVSP